MGAIIWRISCMKILAFISTIVTVSFEPANAIIGFDCASIGNITTISLINREECKIEDENVETSYPEIAVLNLNDFKTDVIQCKVEIHRIIKYCGTSSQNSTTTGDYNEYAYPITREMCETAHNNGTIEIEGITIDGLSLKNQTTKPITLAGSISSTGFCIGETYTDPLGTWDNVFVAGTAKVTLKSAKSVKTKVDSNKIILPSGDQCKLSDGHCVQFVGGYTFWDVVPRTDCDTTSYSTLFLGKATKFESKKETVYSVTVKDTSFTLGIVGSVTSCGVTVLKTEHPELYIVKRIDFERWYRDDITELTSDNSGMFRYKSNEFIYVGSFISSQIKSLYGNFKKYKCKLQKERFENALLYVTEQPDRFAYRYMQKTGYMAITTGEVVHIMQCLPVFVKSRHTNKCYNNRLPIVRENQNLFLTPLTHIITKYAPELPCRSILTQNYKIHGTWYKFMPTPVEAPSPGPLRKDLPFKNLKDLEEFGIYGKEDLYDTSRLIMYSLEQQIMIQQFGDNITGLVSVKDILNEHELDKLAEDFWSRTWGIFIGFGSNFAVLIGIYVFVITIVTIINTCVYGHALYSKYGWSILILAALWDPLARMLLFSGNRGKSQTKSTQSVGRPNNRSEGGDLKD